MSTIKSFDDAFDFYPTASRRPCCRASVAHCGSTAMHWATDWPPPGPTTS